MRETYSAPARLALHPRDSSNATANANWRVRAVWLRGPARSDVTLERAGEVTEQREEVVQQIG